MTSFTRDARLDPWSVRRRLIVALAMLSLAFASLTVIASAAPVDTADTAKSMKATASSDLSSLLPTGDNKDDKRIEKAIRRIDQSLNPAWWIGPSTLDEKRGKHVVDRERQAVRELMKVHTPVQSVIDLLVRADRQLAQVAINDAIAAGGNPREIAKAEREMVKAAQDVSKGRFDKGIKHYKRAWTKAIKAVKGLVQLQLLGINDYHGHLNASTSGTIEGAAGMTLAATDTLVSAAGIHGWDFRDEAETANALVPKLKKRGVEAIVVLLYTRVVRRRHLQATWTRVSASPGPSWRLTPRSTLKST